MPNIATMKNIIPISKFKEGQTVQGFYLCIEKKLRHTRTGELYIDILLRDQTGQVQAKIWNKVKELDKKFSAGDAVAAKGSVEIFIDDYQLVIQHINKATVQRYARYGFDPALIVPTSRFDAKKMWNEAIGAIRSIKNPFIKKLIYNVYMANKQKIMKHPSTILHQYSYRSGFLEQTLSLARTGKFLARHYRLDIDLVVAGIFLFDIGKLEAIESSYKSNLSKAGNLLGHVALGRNIIMASAKKIKKFPSELLLQIEHIMLAQYNFKEGQSQVNPMFKEALLVSMITSLDSQMSIMKKIIEDDQDSQDFTSHYNFFKTTIYKKS